MSIPNFRKLTGEHAYPWQERLFEQFMQAELPSAADIPTGAGKTTIVLLHLLALAQGAPLPRRVIYIVDRRAIVDQTATALRVWIDRMAELPELRTACDGLAAFEAQLPVRLSVLRGGLADDGDWRLDPARPTVIVGTVDLIGSRLLFSGYGNGRSRRAMDAGLLGYDSAIYLDEAHLSPALARVLAELQQIGAAGGERGLRAMRLSATQQAVQGAFTLDDRDAAHPGLQARLNAHKRLDLECTFDRAAMRERIAQRALSLQGAVLVYVQRVEDAKAILKLMHKKHPHGKARTAVLTGTLRGAERAQLMRSEIWHAFRSGRARSDERYWLIATAAGEVGVDLDADHAVMDLQPLDAMTQRLGRVNRDGTGKARVFVVAPFVELEQIADARDVAEASAAEARDKAEQALRKAKDRLAERQAKAKRAQIVAAEKAVAQAEEKLREARLEAAAALEAIAQIQLLRTHDLLAAIGNASPAALRALPPEQVEAASAAPVQTIPLHVETVQALSLTSAPVGLGIDTLLHGIDEHQIPDTYLVWRRDVPALAEAGDLAAAEALAVFPPRPAEVARVPRGVAERLVKKALARLQEDAADATLPVILRDARGQTLVLRLQQAGDLTRIRFANATLLLPPEAGGLIAQNGLPDPASKEVVTDVADDATRHRVLPGEPLPDWAEQATELRIPLTDDSDEPDAEDAEPRALIYLTRRIESGLSTEDSDITRLAATPQTLADHSARVADAAERIGRALMLEPLWIAALREAGAWHDQGKALRLWQRAAGASAEIMAKAKHGRFRPALLGRYRHEFGSLTRAERAGCNDLVLHLIAAHHGWARPDFPDPRQWGPELPHALAAAAARAAAERFGRLQTKLGPWQLAWLEALLKCADAWVSSGRDRAHDAAHAEPPHA